MADELSNYAKAVNATDAVSQFVLASFQAQSIMPALVHTVPLGAQTDTMLQAQRGVFVAADATETSDNTRQDYTQGSLPSLVLKEIGVYWEPTDKQLLFSSVSLAEQLEQAGLALGTKFDTDALAVVDSFTNSVGSTGTALTLSKLSQAITLLRTANVYGQMVAVLHPAQIGDIESEIITSGASYFTGSPDLSILGGRAPMVNGLRGAVLGGLPIFESTNTKSVNGDADWLGTVMVGESSISMLDAGQPTNVDIERDAAGRHLQINAQMWYAVAARSVLAGIEVVSVK